MDQPKSLLNSVRNVADGVFSIFSTPSQTKRNNIRNNVTRRNGVSRSGFKRPLNLHAESQPTRSLPYRNSNVLKNAENYLKSTENSESAENNNVAIEFNEYGNPIFTNSIQVVPFKNRGRAKAHAIRESFPRDRSISPNSRALRNKLMQKAINEEAESNAYYGNIYTSLRTEEDKEKLFNINADLDNIANERNEVLSEFEKSKNELKAKYDADVAAATMAYNNKLRLLKDKYNTEMMQLESEEAHFKTSLNTNIRSIYNTRRSIQSGMQMRSHLKK